MVLENFIMHIMQNGGGVGYAKSFSGEKVDYGNTGGYFYYLYTGAYFANSQSGMYVDVGFGNTPETSGDYKLSDSNAIGDNAGKLTWISSVPSTKYPALRTVISSYRNNTGEDVTIREIGIATKGGSINQPTYNVLLTRKVLESPVVVHPGETVTFTEAIELE